MLWISALKKKPHGQSPLPDVQSRDEIEHNVGVSVLVCAGNSSDFYQGQNLTAAPAPAPYFHKRGQSQLQAELHQNLRGYLFPVRVVDP